MGKGNRRVNENQNEEQIAIPVAETDGSGDMSHLQLTMLGHAHIDLCYRWDIEETIHRIAPMTFRGVLDVMERTPGFTFCQSQMFLYDAMERHYPQIFARILEWINRGQWEVIGGAWCEYDAMLTSGESVIRQHLQGMRYATGTLGVPENRVAFVPDAFIAHAATLPQILSGCGMRYYLFCRGLPEGQKRAFRWLGPDGSELIAFQPFGPYNNPSFTAPYVQKLEPYADNGATDADLALYGIGDHGGGPRDQDIEALESLRDLPTAPRWAYGTAHDYFEGAFHDTAVAKLDTHTGNLPSFATGAMTSQARIKRANRVCERLLLATEATATAATPLQYKPAYPRLDFHRLWRMLLTSQFHDTLPGTAIASAYRQTSEDYRHIDLELGLLMNDSLQRIGSRIDTRGEGYPLLVFNAALQPQTGVVRVAYPEWGHIAEDREGLRLVDGNGRDVPAFFGDDEVTFEAQLPTLGYALYRALPRVGNSDSPKPSAHFEGSTLENTFYRLTFDEATGDLSEVYDKQVKKPLCAGPSFALELHEETDRGNAWTQKFTGEKRTIALVDGPTLVEQTPFLTRVVVRSASRWSIFTREVILYDHTPRIEFRISTDWHDTNAFLKVGFKPSGEALEVTASIAHGSILVEQPEREFCCQDWVHVGNAEGGVALLNDGSYGANFTNGRLGISVVRNVRDMDPGMDLGPHTLRLALVSTQGAFRPSAVQKSLAPFLYPLETLWETDHPGPLGSWSKFDNSEPLPNAGSFVSASNENVDICALKMLEENYTPDAVVVRIRELNGDRTRCDLKLPRPCRSLWRADHLERPIEVIEGETGAEVHPTVQPYEILTLIAYV